MRKRLKQLRKQHGYTQSQLAELLGVKLRAYQFYEEGKRNPSYKNLTKLEDLFGIPQRELLEIEEEKAS
jgi:transcriptional regulator with XRE-family HTH domain